MQPFGGRPVLPQRAACEPLRQPHPVPGRRGPAPAERTPVGVVALEVWVGQRRDEGLLFWVRGCPVPSLRSDSKYPTGLRNGTHQPVALECDQQLVKRHRRVLQRRLLLHQGVDHSDRRQIKKVEDEHVWRHGLDAQRLQLLGREVLEVVGDNRLRPTADGGGQDVPVTRVG